MRTAAQMFDRYCITLIFRICDWRLTSLTQSANKQHMAGKLAQRLRRLADFASGVTFQHSPAASGPSRQPTGPGRTGFPAIVISTSPMLLRGESIEAAHGLSGPA